MHLKGCQSYDFKTAAKKFIKATKPVKMSTVKLKVLETRGSCFGVKDLCSVDFAILKKIHNWGGFTPSILT